LLKDQSSFQRWHVFCENCTQNILKMLSIYAIHPKYPENAVYICHPKPLVVVCVNDWLCLMLLIHSVHVDLFHYTVISMNIIEHVQKRGTLSIAITFTSFLFWFIQKRGTLEPVESRIYMYLLIQISYLIYMYWHVCRDFFGYIYGTQFNITVTYLLSQLYDGTVNQVFRLDSMFFQIKEKAERKPNCSWTSMPSFEKGKDI